MVRGFFLLPIRQATSQSVLKKYCLNEGVSFRFCEKVVKITILNSTISGIITTKGKCSFDKVIVCTGGLSYPSTGSTGDGYGLRKVRGIK